MADLGCWSWLWKLAFGCWDFEVHLFLWSIGSSRPQESSTVWTHQEPYLSTRFQLWWRSHPHLRTPSSLQTPASSSSTLEGQLWRQIPCPDGRHELPPELLMVYSISLYISLLLGSIWLLSVYQFIYPIIGIIVMLQLNLSSYYNIFYHSWWFKKCCRWLATAFFYHFFWGSDSGGPRFPLKVGNISVGKLTVLGIQRFLDSLYSMDSALVRSQVQNVMGNLKGRSITKGWYETSCMLASAFDTTWATAMANICAYWSRSGTSNLLVRL